MESHKIYPRRRQVPWRPLDTEALVVDVKTGLLYPLNGVGARIWQLCDGERSLDDIVVALATEFDADEATIREDARRFVDELAEANLITIDTTPRPPSAAGRRGRQRETGG